MKFSQFEWIVVGILIIIATLLLRILWILTELIASFDVIVVLE